MCICSIGEALIATRCGLGLPGETEYIGVMPVASKPCNEFPGRGRGGTSINTSYKQGQLWKTRTESRATKAKPTSNLIFKKLKPLSSNGILTLLTSTPRRFFSPRCRFSWTTNCCFPCKIHHAFVSASKRAAGPGTNTKACSKPQQLSSGCHPACS